MLAVRARAHTCRGALARLQGLDKKVQERPSIRSVCASCEIEKINPHCLSLCSCCASAFIQNALMAHQCGVASVTLTAAILILDSITAVSIETVSREQTVR